MACRLALASASRSGSRSIPTVGATAARARVSPPGRAAQIRRPAEVTVAARTVGSDRVRRGLLQALAGKIQQLSLGKLGQRCPPVDGDFQRRAHKPFRMVARQDLEMPQKVLTGAAPGPWRPAGPPALPARANREAYADPSPPDCSMFRRELFCPLKRLKDSFYAICISRHEERGPGPSVFMPAEKMHGYQQKEASSCGISL